MPWINAGDVTILRGKSAIISANVPTPAGYILEINFYNDTLVAHWGTVFQEATATLNGASQKYVNFTGNLYRKRVRIDVVNAEGGFADVRLHITKKAALPSYRVLAYRFT